MTGRVSGLSLMYFSPLTLILTLYKAISINLTNTSTFVKADRAQASRLGEQIMHLVLRYLYL